MYLDRVRAAWAAIFTAAWWTELLEATLRQAYQVVLPVLFVVQSAGRVDVDAVKAALLALAGGEIVVVVRRLAALTAPTGASSTTVAFVRALSAFAGALGGWVFVVPVGDVLTLSWGTIVVSAASSAILALLHAALDPAATDVTSDSAGADVPDAPEGD